MKNKELLPCPFCGGEAIKVCGTFNKKICGVMCIDCRAATSVYETNEKAINAWNNRVNTIPVGNGKDYTVVNE